MNIMKILFDIFKSGNTFITLQQLLRYLLRVRIFGNPVSVHRSKKKRKKKRRKKDFDHQRPIKKGNTSAHVLISEVVVKWLTVNNVCIQPLFECCGFVLIWILKTSPQSKLSHLKSKFWDKETSFWEFFLSFYLQIAEQGFHKFTNLISTLWP